MPIQITSLEAYQSVADDLGRRQREVLTILRTIGPATNRQISAATRREINTITPRIKELREKGLVVASGSKIDDTGRRAILWQVVYPEELFR